MTKPRTLLPAQDQKSVGFDDWTKTAGTRLSTNAQMWQTEVAAQIAAAHPYLPVEELSVEFNRIDPVKGAAVGSVKVGMSGVSIPIVIKRARAGGDPELMPTDIFHAENKYQPLTAEAVKSAMQDREFGAPMSNAGQRRATGGNPYIGDLTGDTSPLEFSSQATPFAGGFTGKTAAKIPESVKDTARAAAMGGLAGAGYRGYGALRDIEAEERKGKKLKAKDKAKMLATSMTRGGALGGALAGATHNVAKAIGVESPLRKKQAGIEGPELKEILAAGKFEIRKAAGDMLCERLVKDASMHPNDLANFRALLASNPQVLQGAAATNLRMVEMILRHKGPGAKPPGVKVTNPNILVLVRDPLTAMTRVKFTGGPSETIRNDAELKKLLGDRCTEAMESLRAHGTYVVADDVNQVSWDAARQDASGAKPVERDGMYAIRDRSGGTVMGHVVMQMMRPNGMSVPMRLFVGVDGSYAVAQEMFGVRVGGRNRLPATRAKRNDLGVFVTYVNGTPIATTPLVIKNVATLSTDGPARGDDFVVYNVQDPMNGELMALIPSRSVQSFVRLREIDPTKMALTQGDIYLMPADVEWSKLGGRADVAKSPDQVVKISQVTTNIAVIDGGFHVAHGDKSWRDLEQIEAFELLASMGMHKAADLQSVSDQARSRRGEAVQIKGLHDPVLVEHKIEEEDGNLFPMMSRMTEFMRPSAELLKAAAATGDDQALDVMLGLNFITPQNVRMFVDSIDQFDEVASKLASLLLASRLGLQHVREDAIKEAMEGIARTSEQLRLLQSASQHKRQEQAQNA